jgi:membrane associated rhomboid family serine protease
MPTNNLVRSTSSALKEQAGTIGISLASVWGTFAATVATGGALLSFGIHPRTVQGLWGILAAPFLHANLAHLVSNTVPLALLGWLVMLRDRRHFLPVTLIAALASGLAAWTLGAPDSVHVGASGVVFGYFGFLALAGWYQRSIAAIVISAAVVALWGGVILGVLPGQPGISWQSHLGGFVGGWFAARWLAPRR